VLFLAILVGIFYIAPQIFIWKSVTDAGQSYQAVQLHVNSDVTHFYMPRAREVADGHFPPTDLFFNPNSPSILNPLPPLLMGGFIVLFGGNINAAYLGAIFIFSALLFVVFYFLGRVITGRRIWAYVVGFVGVLTPTALLLPRAFFGLENFLNIIAKNFIPLVKTPLAYLFFSRIDYPLLTEIVYIPALIFLYLFWTTSKRFYALATGVFAGLLFYTYFHHWVYLVIVLGLLFLYTLVFRRTNPARLKGLLIILGIVVLLSLPYWINYINFVGLESVQDYIGRIGYEIGRGFRFASVWAHYLIYTLLAIVVYLLYGRSDKRSVLFWVFLLAAFLVLNIQLVTGFVPYPSHFKRAISPALFMILLSVVYELIRRAGLKFPKMNKIIFVLLVVALVFLPLKKIVNTAVFVSPPKDIVSRYSFPQDIVQSWQWINQNLEKDPRIISSSFLTSVYLSIYTSARPYLPHGGLTIASNYDIEQRYFVTNKLFGINDEDLKDRLNSTLDKDCANFCNKESDDNLRDDYFYLYLNYFRDNSFDWAFTDSDKSIPDRKIEELVENYRKLETDWSKVDAEYVYYGPWERQLSDLDLSQEKDLRRVYENTSVEIYRVIH